MPEIRHGEPTSETVTSARHDTDAGVVEKLKALRTMCEASGQPFYVEILDEVLARLTLPAEPTSEMIEAGRQKLDDYMRGKAEWHWESCQRVAARAIYLAMTKGGGNVG